MSALPRVRKSILRTISVRVLATKKVSWKNQTFSSLSQSKNRYDPTKGFQVQSITLLSLDISSLDEKAFRK